MSHTSEESRPDDPGWFKSSYSGSGNDQCVECRVIEGVGIVVRDSKKPEPSRLRFASGRWSAFLDGIKAGEFDLPG